MQVFFPLLPGVDTVWEPAVEEMEAAMEAIQEGMDEGMDAFRDATQDVQREFQKARESALRRWRKLLKSMPGRDDE